VPLNTKLLPSDVFIDSSIKLRNVFRYQRLVWFVTVALILAGCQSRYPQTKTLRAYVFDLPVLITLTIDDSTVLKQSADLAFSEIARLGEKFDPLNSDGALYLFNMKHKTSDPELYRILDQFKLISGLSKGALNIFIGLVEESYGFGSTNPTAPSPEYLHEVLLPLRRGRLDFSRDQREIKFPNDAYNISLVGVREGYTADQALSYLSMAGSGIGKVQIGNYIACGDSPDGTGWEIPIMDLAGEQEWASLFVENRGVATVTGADRAYIYREIVYHINLDPRTGEPARGLESVTVVAPTCETAGLLAKSVFILGVEEGLEILNSLPGVEGMIVTEDYTVVQTDSLTRWIKG
jgi:thiamine biosynthesis lipoprotein